MSWPEPQPDRGDASLSSDAMSSVAWSARVLLALLLPNHRLGSVYVQLLVPPLLPQGVTMTEAALVRLRAAEQGSYDRSMIAGAVRLGSASWLGASSGWSTMLTVVPPVALGLMLVARASMLFSIRRFTGHSASPSCASIGSSARHRTRRLGRRSQPCRR